MPVSISRVCPHCGITFQAQRQDKAFCSHQCTVQFNNWRHRKMSNAPRSLALIEAYRLHRQRQLKQLQLSEMKLQHIERQLERRRAALEAQVQ